MHLCSPKHSCMRKARIKKYKETDEEGTKRGVSMETSTSGTKVRSPDGFHSRNGLIYPNQNTIINIIF